MIERKPIVINYRPGQGYWLIGGLVFVVMVSLFSGRYWGSRVFDEQMREKVGLEVRAAELEAQLTQSNRDLSRIKLSAEVDAVALENI